MTRGGVNCLLRPNEYPADWDPRKDPRIPIWEMLHQLIRALRDEGESGAGKLLAELKPKSEAIRQLAYRLYTLCERKGQADDARAYNELVTSWSAVESAARPPPLHVRRWVISDHGTSPSNVATMWPTSTPL